MSKAHDRVKLMSHVCIDWNEFKDKKVLDIGPAFGGYTQLAMYHKAKHADAIEIDPEMIKSFIQLNQEEIDYKHVDIKQGDFTNMVTDHYTNQYDIIMFLAVLHHIPNYDKALDLIFQFCKKDGIIYLECPYNRFHSKWNYQPFLHRKKIWHYMPCIADLFFEIEKRGGSVENESYGYTYRHNRVFLKIRKA